MFFSWKGATDGLVLNLVIVLAIMLVLHWL